MSTVAGHAIRAQETHPTSPCRANVDAMRIGIIGMGWVGTSVAMSVLTRGGAPELFVNDFAPGARRRRTKLLSARERPTTRAGSRLRTSWSGRWRMSGACSRCRACSRARGWNGQAHKTARSHAMRHQEATRRAAKKSEHRLNTRLTPGEKANRKRMAQVATVYSVAPYPRTAADIVPSLRDASEVNTKRPRPTDKRVWASVENSSRAVIRETFAEALRRDPDKRRRWVVLVDGENNQLRSVKAEAKRVGAKVTIVADIVHVLEYIWGAARALFGKSNAKRFARHASMPRGRRSYMLSGLLHCGVCGARMTHNGGSVKPYFACSAAAAV